LYKRDFLSDNLKIFVCDTSSRHLKFRIGLAQLDHHIVQIPCYATCGRVYYTTLSIVEMDAATGVGTRIGFSYSGPGNSSFV